MEQYLQNMKSLRSQMNDIEEDAAKRSVEEQMQKTSIEAIEKDLLLVKSETKRLEVESEEMAKEKTQICSQIEEKQKKISSLETESATLSQTLELLQKDVVSVSANLKEKRSYYRKVTEELSVKLQDQQDWFNSYKQMMMTDTQSAEEIPNEHMDHTERNPSGELSIEVNLENMGDEVSETYKDVMTQLESAQTKLKELEARKSRLAEESVKSKQHLEHWKQKIEDAPPALKEMDVQSLVEEHKALLADKAGEMEYLQSLKDQIKQIKGISQVVKCQCGEEYKVELAA